MITKLREHKVLVSSLGLVILLLGGAIYLLVAIVGLNPLKSTFNVTVEMDRSGGLQPRNDVTYRGVRVGKITDIVLTKNGIAAKAEIYDDFNIPLNGTVAVQALSAAGEQYIDFRPTSNEGPYLEEGSVILQERVETPAPISQVLTNASDLLNSIKPDNIAIILDELEIATSGGRDQLRRLGGSISQTVAGLDALLPQTVSLIESLRIIAETTSNAQPDLSTLTSNGGILFDAALAADEELRQVLDTGPGNMASIGQSVSDLTDPITGIAQKLQVIGSSAVLRESAFAALFPSLEGGTYALGLPAFDGDLHLLIEPLPRPFCEYETPVGDPTKIKDKRIRKYQYCLSNRNDIQVRGSANAPRPNTEDNTAGPPPGYDPNELTMELPPR